MPATNEELEARLAVLEGMLGRATQTHSAPVAQTYTTGNFSHNDGNDYNFSKPAFHHPVYGYLVADNIAGDPTGTYPGTAFNNADIIDDLITRQSPYLVLVGPTV